VDDPDLWMMRDCMVDAQGNAVAMPWQPTTYESSVLPAQLTFDRNDPRFYESHVFRSYPSSGATLGQMPDRVRLRIRLEGLGLDFIDDLIASGDLDASYRSKIPVYDLGRELDWTQASATEVFFEGGSPVSCVTTTNLSAAAGKVPAPRYQHCKP
jgi:hypothetical protein